MAHSLAAKRILSSAATLFAIRGFRATTTREIAAHAQVNQTTIFRTFKKGKHELSLAAIAYLAEASRFHSKIEQAMKSCDPEHPQTIEWVISECLGLIEAHPEFVMILWNCILEKTDSDDSRNLQANVRSMYTTPIEEFVYSFCSASILRGRMRGNAFLNAEVLFGILSWKVQLRIADLDFVTPMKTSQDKESLARSIVQLWLYGCASAA